MSDRCPECGAPYTATVAAGTSENHKQVFGGRPNVLFANYPRVCADTDDAEAAVDGDAVPIDLYLHTNHDLAVSKSQEEAAGE